MGGPRRATAAEAIAAIPPGSTVYVAGNSGHPDTLAAELAARGKRLAPLTIVTSLMGELPPYALAESAAWCRVTSFRGTPAAAAGLRAGWIDVVPAHLSAIPALLAAGPLRPSVALVRGVVDGGTLCLGVSVLYHAAAVAAADLVLAEVGGEMPETCGDSRVPLDRVTMLVESRAPLPEAAAPRVGQAERAVAARVAELVPDGATVEVGMGGIGEAVLDALRARRGLRVHAGLLGDGVVGLAEAKALAEGPGSVVTGALYGSRRLYDLAARNPAIELRPVTYTHAPTVLARIQGLVAINGAVEVDLAGQVNAETIDGLPVSGAGGQLDFVRGALESGGRSIIALPATAARGSRSRIVRRLADGVVTTPRADADLVVTEFGVAELRGRTLSERARALAAVADPRFRPELERAAAAAAAGA